MKLGSQTGSLINHLHSRGVIGEPAPKVGQGATLLGWTDRYAATIVSVTEIGGSKLWLYEIEVTRDNTTVVSGSSHDGSAAYSFTSNYAGHREIFRKNKKTGFWEAAYRDSNTLKLRKVSGGGKGIRIGERDEYRDPSF